jgi:hypothetical protein
VVESALEGELDDHRGYGKHDPVTTVLARLPRRSAHAVQGRKVEKACGAFDVGDKGVVVVFGAGVPAWGQAIGLPSFLCRDCAA